MNTIDGIIKELEYLKKEWADKYQELDKYVKECNTHNNSDTPDVIKDKLRDFGNSLCDLGQDYRNKIRKAVDDITKAHTNNPFIKKLADAILSDFDNSEGTNGSREERLRNLAELIDIIENTDSIMNEIDIDKIIEKAECLINDPKVVANKDFKDFIIKFHNEGHLKNGKLDLSNVEEDDREEFYKLVSQFPDKFNDIMLNSI